MAYHNGNNPPQSFKTLGAQKSEVGGKGSCVKWEKSTSKAHFQGIMSWGRCVDVWLQTQGRNCTPKH